VNMDFDCLINNFEDYDDRFKEYDDSIMLYLDKDNLTYGGNWIFYGDGLWEQYSKDPKKYDDSVLEEKGTWECDGDDQFIIKWGQKIYSSETGEWTRGTSDQGASEPTTTTPQEPTTTTPQEPIDPAYSCLEKYYNTIGRKINRSTPNHISVFTKSKKNIWVFGKNKYWGQYNLEKRKIEYNGKWECDGNSNFLINATDGDKYNSRTEKWVTVEPPEQIQPDIIQPDETQPTPTTPTTPTTSPGQKCTAITDSTITKQFENENSLLKYPYDRNYRYKKIGGDWFAKNINNKKVFNITKCGYTTSVEKLNKEFPSGS
jgi:hypothetical protein